MIFAIMRRIHYIKTHIIPPLQVTAWISYREVSTVNGWKRGIYAAENKSGFDTTVIRGKKLPSVPCKSYQFFPYKVLELSRTERICKSHSLDQRSEFMYILEHLKGLKKINETNIPLFCLFGSKIHKKLWIKERL